jgi:hypothetical protein
MSWTDRQLLEHLDDQARNLARLTSLALDHAGESERLRQIRDELFTMRETLDTLGVPHSLVTNADWNRLIGTTGEEEG